MKAKLVVFIGILAVSSASFPIAYASCCFSNIDVSQAAACGMEEPQLSCNCADPGMFFNYCISWQKYCEAFGNIGAR